MDPSRCPEPHFLTDAGLGYTQPAATDLFFGPYPPISPYPNIPVSPADRLIGMLRNPYAVAHPVGLFSIQDAWHQPSIEHSLLFGGGPNLIGTLPSQPQYSPTSALPVLYGNADAIRTRQLADLSYAEKAIQTIQSGLVVESYPGEDHDVVVHTHQRSTPVHSPIFQEIYKPTRRADPKVIEFIVEGEVGIRLSDALEGNWVGFGGRDDRFLFDGDRHQILIRLHLVGCPPWQSKIPTTDFTKAHRPITRMKLATGVAGSVNKFIAREKLFGHDGGNSQCSWGN